MCCFVVLSAMSGVPGANGYVSVLLLPHLSINHMVVVQE